MLPTEAIKLKRKRPLTDEPLYRFVDKTGTCFESFQKIGKLEYRDDGSPCGERASNDYVGAMLRASHHDSKTFSVGDMLAFRDDLTDAGFKWGVDFYVEKV